jgi:hypothetical protein
MHNNTGKAYQYYTEIHFTPVTIKQRTANVSEEKLSFCGEELIKCYWECLQVSHIQFYLEFQQVLLIHSYWEHQEESIIHSYWEGKGVTMLWKSVWKLIKNKQTKKKMKQTKKSTT